MAGSSQSPSGHKGNHFCCSVSAVALARVRRATGEEGIGRMLELAGSERTAAHLVDIGNWISYAEMVALWQAGATVTGDPDFARHVGEDAVAELGSSSTSAVLRALGAPEELMRKVTVAARRFSCVADLTAPVARPGYAEITARARDPFPRSPLHCAWTQGMFTQASVLFGLPPADVEHTACQAEGDPECRYVVRWLTEAEAEADPEAQIAGLRRQVAAMAERLESVFAIASDLISSSDLQETLARITARAALQVRAPQYLLAVRPSPEADVIWHQRGFAEDEARRVAERIIDEEPDGHPEHWLVAPVRSHRTHYGSLAAMYRPGESFFAEERQLLQVYARYAATALDTAWALQEAQARQHEAQDRYRETRALLELARGLATAGSTDEVASRLARAVPAVIDADRVGVFLWDDKRQRLVRRAMHPAEEARTGPTEVSLAEGPSLAGWVERHEQDPVFVDLADKVPLHDALAQLGTAACVAVPIATEEQLLGCLAVSVRERPERLADTPELRDALSGVAAHAVQALENGRLIDHITHQAMHDQLTQLVNRAGFSHHMSRAAERAEDPDARLALFYVDLDAFKPVNDEFGHEAGDRLLRAVADRLARVVREEDVVARLGGDEFAVLVRAEAEERLAAVAARLERAFADPFAVDGHELVIRASIGRAVWPSDVATHDDLLRHADEAMYRAKHRRRAAAMDRTGHAAGQPR